MPPHLPHPCPADSSHRRHVITLILLAVAPIPAAAQTGMGAMRMEHGEGIAPSGMMIIPMIKTPMIPGLSDDQPKMTPFLPGAGIPWDSLPPARPRELLTLKDGDTLTLEARLVRREFNGKKLKVYGYNGQYPGPLLRVRQNATIVVRFVNRIDLPSTIHWHGVRLDNRFDGAAGVTQDPVEPGNSFVYRVHFKDAGVYWYHDHIREDIAQDLGLYGNIVVESLRKDYYNPVNAEEVLMVDDILIAGDTLLPYGKETANFALMGRFGNMMMVNGEPHYHLAVNQGDVVRFLFTNVASARTYNLSIGDLPLKLVGADLGRFEREMMVSSVVIAPAQRYVIEVKFDRPGEYQLTNRVQAIDHLLGEFYPAVDTLGMIEVLGQPTKQDHRAAFASLRQDDSLAAELTRLRPQFGRPVDKEITLSVTLDSLPVSMLRFISIDTAYRAPVEWTDAMADMNWISTGNRVHWMITDSATGQHNMDIAWRFKLGDVVKIRVNNDPFSFHPMNHPIHFHGQRFLVLSKDGIPNRNLVWRDTELLAVGSTADVLLELSNPGKWMMHCHIAEHLQAGMMMTFTVE